MSSPGITKKAIADAMKKLMAERPLAKVNVGDIVDICGLNRNSFYYHFKDKYELVIWIFQVEFIETMRVHPFSDPWATLSEVCSYMFHEREFYRNALSYEGQNSFQDFFLSFLRSMVGLIFRERFSEKADIGFFCNFIADSVLCSLKRWLSTEPVIHPDVYVTNLKSVVKMLS